MGTPSTMPAAGPPLGQRGRAVLLLMLPWLAVAGGRLASQPALVDLAWVPPPAAALGLPTLGVAALLSLGRHPTLARGLLSLLVLIPAALAWPMLRTSPLGALTAGWLLVQAMAALWLPRLRDVGRWVPAARAAADVSAGPALVVLGGTAWVLGMGGLAGLWESAAAWGAGVLWLLHQGAPRRRPAAVASPGAAALLWLAWGVGSSLLALPAVRSAGLLLTACWPAAALLVRFASPVLRDTEARSNPLLQTLEALLERPALFLVSSFAGLSAVGTLLLWMPASAAGERLPLLDAAFTAVSASCVTGLSVIDVGRQLSPWGQGVLVVLMQLGGLGIMVWSVLLITLLGRRLSVRQEQALAGTLQEEDRRRFGMLIRRIVGMTLGVEAVAALLLLPVWLTTEGGMGWGEAAWRSVFTAVSAFCQGGFALDGDGLMGWRHRPAAVVLVALIMLVSSLGPQVFWAAWDARHHRRLPATARVILGMSLGLAALGTVVFVAVERRGVLQGLGPLEQVAHAFFLSMTARSAGLNTLDTGALQPASLFLLMGLMWIGGAPGSTAGGLKVTTAFVLLMALPAGLAGTLRLQWGRLYIGLGTLLRAVAVVMASLLTIFACTLLLLALHPMDIPEALFEALSAGATVGLSMGITGDLNSQGRLLIIVTMLSGRVGPLTLLALFSRPDRPGRVQWPEDTLPIG